jgi:hypothetical protein
LKNRLALVICNEAIRLLLLGFLLGLRDTLSDLGRSWLVTWLSEHFGKGHRETGNNVDLRDLLLVFAWSD